MGFSIAWLAVQAPGDLETLYGELRVRPTDRPDALFESPLSGGQLGSWFLLVGQKCDHRIIDADLLARLSAQRALVACAVEEHVMFSSAAGWERGRAGWSLVHDAQRGVLDLTVTGRPPEVFEEVRRDLLAKQAAEGGDPGTDYVFDIPLQVARSVVGFKHDEGNDWVDGEVLHVFEDLAPRRRWWWFR